MCKVLRINEIRNLTIFIDKRPNTNDNTLFFSKGILQGSNVLSYSIYSLQFIQLNYSIISSSVTGTLVLGYSVPQTIDNIFRSGQPIVVTDNGEIVFQGILLTPMYELTPIDENGNGGLFMTATLAPSIYDFVLAPAIFNNVQAQQLSQMTGTIVEGFLVGNVTQSANTQGLLNYMITNTRYSNYFNKTINAMDLADNIYVMAGVNDKKDDVIRKSIDYYNCVFYQQENGDIIIRQLDPSIECPFDVDLTNSNLGGTGDDVTVTPLITYTYIDNAYSTPSAISNYAILPTNIGIVNKVTGVVLTYVPNPEFYPAIKELGQGGWFIGENGRTQIDNNIVNNPTTYQALLNFQVFKDQYMLSSQASGIADQGVAAYQALLTAKELAKSLAGYANLNGVINLDDKNLANTDTQSVLGTVMQIYNCDMSSGLVATVSRTYSDAGSFLAFSAVPLGSYTGYWKNSNFRPNFG